MAETPLAKLRWACRRGMLELDILLSRFLEEKYPTLSVEEKKIFEKLLTCQDPDLFNWLTGNVQPKKEFIFIVNCIIAHAHDQKI